MSDCICESTPKTDCRYHGALHRSTLRKLWPTQEPVADLRVRTVTISRRRYEDLCNIEARAQELLEIIKREKACK